MDRIDKSSEDKTVANLEAYMRPKKVTTSMKCSTTITLSIATTL